MERYGRKARRTVAVLLFSAPLLFGGLSAHASVDDFEFERFDAVYEIGITENRVATLHTTETLIARFPDFDQNRGIARYLATTYLGRPLDTDVTGVFDENGTERPWTTLREDGALVVESVVPTGQYLRGPQTYVIDYRQRDVVRDFGDTTGVQEFYWDVNGLGWRQPFGVVTAEIRIPAELAVSVTKTGEACYQGERGSSTPCDIVREVLPDGTVVFLAEAGPLRPFETMTVAIGFQPGTFAAPSATAVPWLSSAAHLLALLGGVIALAWGIGVRMASLKDAPGYPVVVPQYLPPRDVTIDQASILLSRTATIPLAGLLQLAVGGKVRLGEQEGWGKKWTLTRTTVALDPFDETLLTVLFGRVPAAGETIPLPKNSTRVAKRLDNFVSQTRREMVAGGFYRKVPLAVRVGPGLVAGFAGLTAIAGFVFLNDQAGNLLTLLGGGGGLAMAIATVFFLSKNPKGRLGSELRDYLKGLTDYITLAEADRLHFLQSPEGALREKISADDPREVLKLYERVLPWAVVVGEEKRWVKELDRLYRDENPSWIVGNNRRLTSALSSLSSASASSFRSASTGGTGGGGSAGGGGGGGGGGGR